MNNSKLLKELIIFISKCEKLEILSFEHISMSEILFGFLGKALASGCSGILILFKYKTTLVMEIFSSLCRIEMAIVPLV